MMDQDYFSHEFQHFGSGNNKILKNRSFIYYLGIPWMSLK